MILSLESQTFAIRLLEVEGNGYGFNPGKQQQGGSFFFTRATTKKRLI